MAILTVGPTSTYDSITDAMAFTAPGDTIVLESGYSNETATITQGGVIIDGGATSTGIVLQLGTGIATFTITGDAPIAIIDGPDANGIVGNAGDNLITVSSGVDAVNGGAGIDRLVVDYSLATGSVTGNAASNFTEAGGGARSVTITDGTFENFTVTTGGQADTLTFGAGDNIIDVADGANTVTTGSGDNTIYGGVNADTFTVGDGANLIVAGAGANTVTAGNGLNTISGGDGADVVTALDGGNIIDGGDGANILTSGAGDDTILSGNGAATIVAGAGTDMVSVQGGAATVDAGADEDSLIVDYRAMVTDMTGGVTTGDLPTGYTGIIQDAAANSVGFVGTENLTILAGSGNDSLLSGDGADSIDGNDGNDSLSSGGGDDTVTGGSGDDTITGGSGADSMVGGIGTDRLDYSDAPGGVSIDIDAGTAQDGYGDTDSISGFEEFTLTDQADTVVAGDGAQDIDLGGGNDSLVWQSGDGNDTIRLGEGSDTLDLAGWTGEPGNPWSTVDGGGGATEFSNGSDTLTVYGFDTLNDAVTCFAEGTMIVTERGEVPVESLQTGDLVLTMHDGPQLMPLRWVGRTCIDITRQRNKAAVAPVRILAGALLDGAPCRDLRVSPDHAIFLDGHLVLARMLVNGETVIQEDWCRTVTYYHLELEGHGLLVSDGAVTESYLDDGNRSLFDNASVARIAVDFEMHRGNGTYAGAACAPVMSAGPRLDRILSRMAQQARKSERAA